MCVYDVYGACIYFGLMCHVLNIHMPVSVRRVRVVFLIESFQDSTGMSILKLVKGEGKP